MSSTPSTPLSLQSNSNPNIKIPRWEDRVFEFFPSNPGQAQTLSSDQVEHYNREGYIKGLPAFSKEEADLNRRYFDGLLNQVREQGRDSYALNWYHKACAGIYDLCKHPSILNYVRDILGPYLVCWGSHF